MIIIDGSMGEGGGQVLRSSLSLSAITDQPVRISNVRGKRPRPGLLRQHLTALLAAQQICDGHVSGAELGSREVTFHAGTVRAGEYSFSIGTAGSTSLVLQTVLPILLHADGPSKITLKGGTHNPSSPSFDFLKTAYFPALRAIGYRVDARLSHYGFFPAGGGEIEVEILPTRETRAFALEDRGAEVSRRLECVISNLSSHIAERELGVAGSALDVPEDARHTATRHSMGPGNVLCASLKFANVTALFTEFGRQGVSSEKVASNLSKAAKAFLESSAAVTPHLADQLLLPMALAKGGLFTTLAPNLHARTNAEVIGKFLDRRITFDENANCYSCVVNSA
ncbi:MAG: RNA 3'-terminal phosphate cyclase [Kiloniellales bacterium]